MAEKSVVTERESRERYVKMRETGALEDSDVYKQRSSLVSSKATTDRLVSVQPFTPGFRSVLLRVCMLWYRSREGTLRLVW